MGKFDRQLPLNGEIVGAPATASSESAGSRIDDFIDAEFEEVGTPSRDRDNSEPVPQDAAIAPLSVDGLSLLKRQAGERVAEKGSVAFYLAGAAIAFMAFWIAGGYAFFPNLLHDPAMNSAGASLSLDDITTSTVTVNGHPIILVKGTIFNGGAETAKSPPVKIVVTTKTGKIVSYQLGSSSWPLAPGESMPFSSRLDAPATGVESVHVGLSGKGKL